MLSSGSSDKVGNTEEKKTDKQLSSGDEKPSLADVPAKKRASPFLSSEVKSQATDEATEDSSAKKQHEIIDTLSKDKSVFNDIGKLYFFSTKTKKPETRGEGKFLILSDDTGMFKLMMIRDQVMLKGCNHYISPSCPLTKATQAKNSWVWTAIEDKSDAEKNEEKTVYFAMFKDEEVSRRFEEKYKYAMEMNERILSAKKLEKSTKIENK